MMVAEQVCVVTGGTQGIGWAITRALAERGAVVYACGRSAANLAAAQAARDALAAPGAIHLQQCDVTDRAAFEGWLDGIYEANGRLDILINNAAHVRWVDVTAMSVEEAILTMAVGYNGMVYGVKKVLPWMLAAGQGQIVNIGSITGNIFVGSASAAYAASKAAVDAYSQTLQIELRESPVDVTLVRLGAVGGTDFFKKHVPRTRMPRLTDLLPAMTPSEAARVILQAIDRRQRIVTRPRYYSLVYPLFAAMPALFRWLARIGGHSRRQYADLTGQ